MQPKPAWLAYVLPLGVFLLVGSLEPTPQTPGGAAIGLAIPYSAYPWVYAAKILATLAALAWAWPEYRQFPPRVVPLSIVVGVLGAVVWIVLARWRPEARLLELLGLGRLLGGAARSGYNPLQELAAQPLAAWSFLALRWFGLVVVIAVAEEFFLRGLVLRLVVDEHWHRIPIGQLNAAGVAVGTLLPMLMHPGELLAAAVWFTLVTWLSARTRNIWDCVLAHALTNLGLAIYVLSSGHWELL